MCTAGSAGTAASGRQEWYGRIGMAASAWQDLPVSICRYGRIDMAGSVWHHVHGRICTSGLQVRQDLPVSICRYSSICTAGSIRQDLHAGWREHAPSSQFDDVFVFSITSQLHTLM